jgi:ribonuclease HI
MAELWGLHEGLLLARSCGVQQLEIQLDSKVVVCSLKEGKIGSASSWSLIKKIKLLLNHSWQVKITHVYREANRCADILANIDCVSSTTTTVYTQPPPKMLQVLADDFRGVSLPRLVAM